MQYLIFDKQEYLSKGICSFVVSIVAADGLAQVPRHWWDSNDKVSFFLCTGLVLEGLSCVLEINSF